MEEDEEKAVEDVEEEKDNENEKVSSLVYIKISI